MKQTSTWNVTLTSKISDFGPQRIQDLLLPSHCIQRERERERERGREVVWRALSSIGIFSPVFINGTVTSDIRLSLLSEEFAPFQMIRYSSEFSLVSRRQCEISRQQSRT
jgi:hypothetical protein